VGDDDQSIYSWRGANFENLLMFERDFPGVREIKLEQNYRSTGTILEAANGVISPNTQRKEKKLWSGQGGGRPIGIFYPDDEDAEGEFIAATIKGLRAGDNYPWRDFGVLTRTNSGSRAIEEAFLANNIPYIVSGGESFFERAEVKDILAYLRVVANSDDDVNLIRIINTPRRGIGKQTIAAVSGEARLARCSLWAALCRAVPRREEEEEFALSGAEEKKPGIRNEEEVSDFLELVNNLKDNFFSRKGNRQNPFSVKVRNMLDQINYRNYLKVEYAKNEKLLKWKLANIEYLLQSIERWEEDAAANGSDAGLWAYLNRVSLLNREDGEDEEGAGKVGLMTIHAAKGLEFPVVFIAGAEKGIIPHERSVEENAGNIEEERRLFYVAITRAREKLILTCCKKRRRQNALADCDPSPFLEEIPPGLIALEEEEKPVEDPAAIRDYFAKIKESLAACRA
jgi:DNA helicase-2/ATP-dependent DNA helicase PcrA